MPPRILVVDDEPDVEHLIRQKFRSQIRDNRFEFDFAQNGVQALHKVRQDETIDLVLTDINMPEMDGLTLLRKIEDLKNPALKAVIVSAYGDMVNIRTAMNHGAFDFITKPIDFHDLEVTIAKTLSHLDLIKQAQKEHSELISVQRDLSIAARIQQSILPRTFPPFPDRKEFAIYAEMVPMKEVGGDFFDFFFIDNDRLALIIGDVSGKGVPAAILMAMSRTLLKAMAQQVVNPGECLRRVNNILAAESDPSMFVTIFYGVLNIRTGELQYCNGAHNPPCVLHADGTVEVLEEIGGTVIGMMENLEFDVKRTPLRVGDTLFMYTDGVTEAKNSHEELFSEARLLECLQRSNGLPLEEMIRKTLGEIRTYSGGIPQPDDITMLAVRYLGT
jgi:sigma-B regulation protein RsbU (phosphoserine phosphatase)